MKSYSGFPSLFFSPQSLVQTPLLVLAHDRILPRALNPLILFVVFLLVLVGRVGQVVAVQGGEEDDVRPVQAGGPPHAGKGEALPRVVAHASLVLQGS